jgi:hypothetical protein
LCENCYDLGGIENQIADQGETPELLAEVKALEEKIERLKGGKDMRDQVIEKLWRVAIYLLHNEYRDTPEAYWTIDELINSFESEAD